MGGRCGCAGTLSSTRCAGYQPLFEWKMVVGLFGRFRELDWQTVFKATCSFCWCKPIHFWQNKGGTCASNVSRKSVGGEVWHLRGRLTQLSSYFRICSYIVDHHIYTYVYLHTCTVVDALQRSPPTKQAHNLSRDSQPINKTRTLSNKSRDR